MAAPQYSRSSNSIQGNVPEATPDKVMAEIVAISTQSNILCDGGPMEYFTGQTDGRREMIINGQYNL